MPEKLYQILGKEKHNRALLYYRASNAIWLWLGAAAIITAVAWFVDPAGSSQRSAVGRQLSGPLDEAWVVGMALGGLLMFGGIWYFRIRMEIVGHMVLSAAVTINCVAVLTEFHITSTSLILGGVAIASSWRAWFLWKIAEGSRF